MTVQRLGRDTTSVDALTWNGRSFGDAAADSMWEQLAEPVKSEDPQCFEALGQNQGMVVYRVHWSQ